jgi:hypothetical protein
LTHAGAEWQNTATPRIAILNCYGPIMAQYQRLNVPPEVIEAMPPKRRTLFRGVWGHGPRRDGSDKQSINDYYGPDNRAY